MIMTILAATLMLKIKYNKSKVFILFLEFNFCHNLLLKFLFEELGKNEQIPIGISIWIPLIIIILFSTISLMINENKIKFF